MRYLILILLLFLFQNAFAQAAADFIRAADVQKHLLFLAGDSLKGRGNYTPELQRAAQYIAAEYRQAGAAFLPTLTSYFQPFSTKGIAADRLQPDGSGSYDPDSVLLNVIGVLPGRSRPEELVLFTAHYDHLGTIRSRKDSVYNGANDNASGTAALITLMHYYAKHAANERTLVFCAFAGEEIGLKGASALVPLLRADAVKAVINIEMIGRHGAAGANRFFVTGASQSNLAAHLRKVLKEQGIRVVSEPAEEKQLFMRSDNYPFVQQGIPAHTIMSSDDDDGCYHQTCDEVSRIDLPHMTAVIRGIILGCRALVDGTFTPSRIRW